MVSTDSQEIGEIAKKYGAKVPFLRSEKTSDDYATTSDVLLEVISRYKEQGREFQYICCIYPTAPFVTKEKLTEAIELIDAKKALAVMPIVEFSYPPQRCYVMNANSSIEYKYPQYARSRSQDLEKQYHDAGQFYVYDTVNYLKNQGKIWKNILPVVVSELEVQDIDNETDWRLAELKYQLMCK